MLCRCPSTGRCDLRRVHVASRARRTHTASAWTGCILQGQFGTVYEAHAKSGEAGPRMAAKVVWKAKLEDPVLDSVDLISEISVMMQVRVVGVVT